MAGQKKTVYPDNRLVVGLIILLFGLVYVGAAWFPETVKLVFNIKGDGNAADGQFAGFGTIGDFFGGVINPILTFITIYLLLVSIRIQRDEMAETQREMRQANEHAEVMARAAESSLTVNRDALRPFLAVESVSTEYRVFAEIDDTDTNPSIKIIGRNVGESLARISLIKLKLIVGKATDEGCYESNYEFFGEYKNNFRPIPSKENFSINIDMSRNDFDEGIFEDLCEYYEEFNEYKKRIMLGLKAKRKYSTYPLYLQWNVELEYSDVFCQDWRTSCEIITIGTDTDYEGEVREIVDRKLKDGLLNFRG